MSEFSKKRAAQELFITKEWSIDEICNLLNLDSDKLKGWIQKGKWERQKATFKTNSTSILKLEQEAFEKFLITHQDTNDWETLLKGIEAFTKNIEKAKEGATTPAAAQEVMIKFSIYIESEISSSKKPITFDTLLDYQNSFLEIYYL